MLTDFNTSLKQLADNSQVAPLRFFFVQANDQLAYVGADLSSRPTRPDCLHDTAHDTAHDTYVTR